CGGGILGGGGLPARSPALLEDSRLGRCTQRVTTEGGGPRGARSHVGDGRAVKRSDLAGPSSSGDVGPAISAHLADELRPDLAQDRPPVKRIIPEMCKHLLRVPRRAAGKQVAEQSRRIG